MTSTRVLNWIDPNNGPTDWSRDHGMNINIYRIAPTHGGRSLRRIEDNFTLVTGGSYNAVLRRCIVALDEELPVRGDITYNGMEVRDATMSSFLDSGIRSQMEKIFHPLSAGTHGAGYLNVPVRRLSVQDVSDRIFHVELGGLRNIAIDSNIPSNWAGKSIYIVLVIWRSPWAPPGGVHLVGCSEFLYS